MRLAKLALAAAVSIAAQPLFAQMPAAAPAAEMKHKTITPSTSLTLLGPNGNTITYTLAPLAKLPHITVTVYNLHEKRTEKYDGVELGYLLTGAGVPFNAATQHDMLHSYVIAQGSDQYEAFYSTVEVYAPDYHSGSVIVADTMDGKPLTEDGIKLISTEDKHPMRWVHSLTKVIVVKTVN